MQFSIAQLYKADWWDDCKWWNGCGSSDGLF